MMMNKMKTLLKKFGFLIKLDQTIRKDQQEVKRVKRKGRRKDLLLDLEDQQHDQILSQFKL
jgi:hypothetical protein